MKNDCKKYLLILFLIVLALLTFHCEHKNAVTPPDNDGCDVTWQQSGLDSLWPGLDSLRVTVLAANSTGDVFAASCRDGVFRSSDHGTTWKFLAPDFCLRSMAINSDGVIFASQQLLFDSSLLRSRDNGESWETLDTPQGVNIKPIAFSSSGDVFAGSQRSDESRGGIYVSRDRGDSWTQTGLPDSIGADALAINDRGHIFAGTGFGVYLSTDDGQTWNQINHGFEDIQGNPVVDALGIHPLTGYIFSALGGKGVYRLIDKEEGWFRTNLAVRGIQSLVFNPNGDIFAGARIDPSGPEGVFCSKDNGENWMQINTGLTNTDVRALTVDSSGLLYVGSFFPTGVFRSVSSTGQ